MNKDNKPENQNMTFVALLLSVLSAFVGVQSNANRERDFSKGKLSHFIIIGLALGLIFILTVIGVVKIVISTAGA